jgi:hypothetical protein
VIDKNLVRVGLQTRAPLKASAAEQMPLQAG